MRGLFYSLLGYFLTPAGLVLLGALDSSMMFFLPLGIDFIVILLTARKPELFWLYAILATVRPDGRPQAAPVAFDVKDGAFWIATVAGARVRNLKATPDAALVISEGERGNHRAVRVEGPVTLHEQDALAAVRKKLDAAWEERQGSLPDWAAAFIELRPETIYSYDSALVHK